MVIISLVGPRTVGKTTIGKELSNISDYKFINLDQFMSKKLKSYGGIFGYVNKFSWNKYFKLVNTVLKDLIKKYKTKNIVLDLGGGTTASRFSASKENAKFIRKISNVFLILPTKSKKENLEIIFKREYLRNKKGSNTWAEGWSKKKFDKAIKEHYNLRVPKFKEHADYIVYTKYKSPKQIAKSILKLVK